MTAGFVGETESWPEAAPFELEVLDDGDGEYGHLFTPTAAEMVILGPKLREPLPDASLLGSRLVIPVSFSTLDQALRAGKLLADAFAAVQAIHAERVPPLQECEHRTRTRFFSRSPHKHTVCELCGTHLEVVSLNPNAPILRTPDGLPAGWEVRVEDRVPILRRST